jgi:Helix-turn-helix domain
MSYPKRLPCPERVRRVPAQFSWVDQRLVRDGHIQRCGTTALALYLFLVTVSDREGLSYYGQRTLARHLSMEEAAVAAARAELIQAGLIAFRPPLYQVLSLQPPEPPRRCGMQSAAVLLEQLATSRK